MDFFAHQQAARRNSARLVFFFVLAVLLIIAALNLIVLVFIPPASIADMLGSIFFISFFTVLIILSGSLWRFWQLRGGGDKVAHMLGALRISANSHDLQYQRLRNVVEEMAIAAGIPAPALYVLEEEEGINAMVAGLRPGDAALIVTRGALTHLNREQLQAVVAHEFSHVFHGDMRLNIRLIMVLGGLFLIGRIGLEILWRAPRMRSKNSAPLLLLGLGVAAVGFIGIFFGELIKAGISRQREFLADATAVQYTRNPRALMGALAKIQAQGSQLSNRNALEVSHLCFGEGVSLGRWMATHPPLEKRIGRLQESAHEQLAMPHLPASPAPNSPPETTTAPQFLHAAALLAAVGNPSPAHLHYAEELRTTLPRVLLDLTRTPEDAQVLVYALLLRENTATAWRDVLDEIGGKTLIARVQNTRATLDHSDARMYLPLLDLALPVLKSMDKQNRRQFLKSVQAFMESDARLSVFEHLLWIVLSKHLHAPKAALMASKSLSLSEVDKAAGLILSLLLYAGETAEEAYAEALQALSLYVLRQPHSACTGEAVRDALAQLAHLKPAHKRDFLHACADCVLHDGRITVHEGEILRLVAEALDSPMPPLLTAGKT
jgi:Zn-dependent protease with chaperone function